MLRLSDNNTKLTIETSYPIIGLTFLVCFLEGTRKLTSSKEFRVSYDNSNWTSWLDLSTTNLNTIEIEDTHKLFIDFRFSDFSDIETGLSEQVEDKYYRETLFSKYFKSYNFYTLQWIENILEKLFVKSGTLANYIERQNEREFEDFVGFWFSILKYFSYYTKLAAVFSKFNQVNELLEEYLVQRDIILTGNESLEDLQEIQKTYFYQMVKRGTLVIFNEEDNQGLQGDFLRLIKKGELEEFLYNIYKPQNRGWNLSHHSPLYRGLSEESGFCKLWSWNNFPLINTTGVSINEDTQEITLTSGGVETGIGGDDTKRILVDSRMNYSLFLDIEVIQDIVLDIKIKGFDKDFNEVELLSHRTDLENTGVLNEQLLSRNTSIVVNIYNTEKPKWIHDSLNILVGENLKFKTGIKYIVPTIKISEGSCIIRNLVLVPLFTDYNRGFMLSKHMSVIGINNSGKELREVVETSERKLLPYDEHLLISNVGDYIYKDEHNLIVDPNEENEFYYIGAEPSCIYDEGAGEGIFTEQFTTPFV